MGEETASGSLHSHPKMPKAGIFGDPPLLLSLPRGGIPRSRSRGQGVSGVVAARVNPGLDPSEPAGHLPQWTQRSQRKKGLLPQRTLRAQRTTAIGIRARNKKIQWLFSAHAL